MNLEKLKLHRDLVYLVGYLLTSAHGLYDVPSEWPSRR